SIADRVAKTAIDTNAKCFNQAKANDCRGQPWEQADHAGAVRHTSRADSQYRHLDQSSCRVLASQSEHHNDQRERSRSLISVALRSQQITVSATRSTEWPLTAALSLAFTPSQSGKIRPPAK